MTMSPAEFAAECRRIAAAADDTASPVVKRGANNIKLAARQNSQHTYTGKQVATYHINYDMLAKLEAEIGYDKMAGSLGTMNEYGSANNVPDNALGNALEEEAPKFAAWLAREVERLWR